jgi:hypothetical protein
MKGHAAEIAELKSQMARLLREVARMNVRDAKPNLKKQPSLIVKPDADIAKGDTDTCSVYTVLEEDTGLDIEATALGAAVTGGLYAVAWLDPSGRWAVGPWECA